MSEFLLFGNRRTSFAMADEKTTTDQLRSDTERAGLGLEIVQATHGAHQARGFQRLLHQAKRGKTLTQEG